MDLWRRGASIANTETWNCLTITGTAYILLNLNTIPRRPSPRADQARPTRTMKAPGALMVLYLEEHSRPPRAKYIGSSCPATKPSGPHRLPPRWLPLEPPLPLRGGLASHTNSYGSVISTIRNYTYWNCTAFLLAAFQKTILWCCPR